jgi:iron complex outermembrane receptor protein
VVASRKIKLSPVLVLAIGMLVWQAHAVAAEIDSAVHFNIKAQNLGNALNEFALQSGKEILFVEEEIADKSTSGISGSYQPIAALEQLLTDAGLQYRVNDLNTILVGTQIRVLTGEPSKPRNIFRRIASGVATVFRDTRTPNNTVHVAAGDEGEMEEIVVVGIRGSMLRSLQRKRNADHFVDAITAEDIGAFPDQNLAESLQRISGVAIDRKSGEGAFISVRGLGPQFVQTTIHGRVSASNVAPGSHDGTGQTNAKSRAVGFHAFQSGLVQAVEINKSPRADHVEGGLGGFVDIQTRKPLELGKRHMALSLDATRNELANDTAPGVFALFSDVLRDNLGLMVSAQWDNREFRTDYLEQFGFLGDPRTVTLNGVEMTGYYPSQLDGELHLTNRDRLNVSSALQWQPSDRVDVAVDVLFTDNSTDEARHSRSFQLSQGHQRITEATLIDDNGTGVFTMISTSGAGAFIEHATEQTATEALNLGINLKFQATDNLALNVDVSVSDTEAPITNRDALMRNTSTQMTYRKNGSGRLPSMSSSSPLTDVDHWSVVKQSFQKHVVDDRLSQFRVDATYEFEGSWLDSIQAGARTYRQDRRDRSRYLNSRAFIDQPIADFGGGVAFPEDGNFLSGLGMVFPAPILNPNFDALQQTFSTRADEILSGGGFRTGAQINNGVVTFDQDNFNEDLNHDDDGNAIYAMVTFRGALGDTPYSGNLGVRVVDNSTGSVGEIAVPIDIDFSDPTQGVVIVSPPEFLHIAHDYTEVLPSLNLRFDLTDFVIRASVAKVLSRPRFLDLSPRQTVQTPTRTTRGGNGKLDPTTAVQFDLAVEWYFADYSIASIGLFTKNIEAFVQSQGVPTPFPGVIDPDTNQPLVLTAFRPLNTGKSDMVGVELSFQRTFADFLPAPFDGLGVVANYTYIDSGSDFKNDKTGASYSLPGLSENTLNFTLFYEKGPVGARISYNFRDDFLDDINGGFSGHPFFVDAYKQWDASFGYVVNENIALSLEAINLTDENVYYYNRLATGTQEHISSLIHAGRRFQLGVRLKI